MTRYVALIRGINVGGKGKVSMTQLKEELITAGFKDVSTYINSGNVIFSSLKTNITGLVEEFELILKHKFSVETHVAVISVEEFHDDFTHAPKWWGVDDDKHNVLFVIAPATSEEIYKEVGEAKPEYEKVDFRGHMIFWSAPLKTFSRSRWSKIVGTPAYNKVTIRNANTTKKLIELTKDSVK